QRRRRGGAPFGQIAELLDQLAVAALRFRLTGFELVENELDAVDGRQNERDGVSRDRHAVAKFAHQGFGGVRQSFEPRQGEKAAGALDGVDQPEDVAEDVAVVRLALEAHQLGVDPLETLVGLGQKLTQQVVHTNAPLQPAVPDGTRRTSTHGGRRERAPRSPGAQGTRSDALSLLPNSLISVAGEAHRRRYFALPPCRDGGQEAATTTVSPSTVAATEKPQSRARMPV